MFRFATPRFARFFVLEAGADSLVRRDGHLLDLPEGLPPTAMTPEDFMAKLRAMD